MNHIHGGIIDHVDLEPFIRKITVAKNVIAAKAATLEWIGAPTGEVEVEGKGYYREFQNATLWAPINADDTTTAAFEVHGDIRNYHVAIGRGNAVVGCPLSDETSTSDGRGRFNLFQNGVIYWSPQTGAHEVYGMILQQWTSLGMEKSWLGYPITGEQFAIGHNPHRGRISSFENGQITFKNGQLATHNFKDAMLGRFASIGGIRSPLGLPWDLTTPISRNGNQMLMSFRGGTVTVPLNTPNPNAMTTEKVQIWWVGLECVARQESEDELSGAVSCFCPSTVNSTPVPFGGWQMGHDGARIMNTRNLIYEGAPADVLIHTSLVELDTSAGNPMKVANDIVGVLQESAQVLQAAGGVISNDNVATAAGREAGTVAEKYKEIQNSKIWAFLVNLFDSPDDPYQPGFLALKSFELKGRSLPKKLLTRPDDPNTITYTEAVTVTGVDNGGDRGIYTFYFDVNVLDVQIPL